MSINNQTEVLHTMDHATRCKLMDNDEVNELVNDVLTEVLSDPGTFDAVTLRVIKDLGSRDLKYLHNQGFNELQDLPYSYLWNRIIGLEL